MQNVIFIIKEMIKHCNLPQTKNNTDEPRLILAHFIFCMQEELKEMKKKEERRTKEMGELLQKNKELIESPQRAKEEAAELQKQLVNYEKDKSALAVGHIFNNIITISH